MNHFIHTDQNKRYYTLDYFYKKKFNHKVCKISLNAGFSCPNIDGKVGRKGCIYCSLSGSGEFAGDPKESLEIQFKKGKEMMKKKWPDSKFIAYFQAHTNTYAPLPILKKKYECMLKKDVIGISIATRCDAITEECLDYLEDLNKRTYLTIELGLQTIHPKTSTYINRCHDLKSFENMVYKLHQRNINIVVHIINGLPYETKEMMIETVKYLNKLPIQGIKIHMLYILKNTLLAKKYESEKFHILTKKEYIDIVCCQIENLREDIVVHRITADPLEEDLIEPKWLLKKFSILNDIDKELKRRDTYQGFNKSILNYVKRRIDYYVKQNDLVVDATIGNGFDTLYLCNLTPKGKVFGFDIQDEAIANTKKLLENKNNYKLFKVSHENINTVLKDYNGKISLVLFNLGYLPNGNKKITTKVDSTIKAIQNSFELLNHKGVILVTIYPGHQEGLKESIEIKKLLKKNEYKYKEYHNTDNKIAPYLIEIIK